MLFFKKKPKPKQESHEERSLSPYDSMFAIGGGYNSSARTAQGLSAVYAAVELISTAMATAKPKIYSSDGVTKALDLNHPLNSLLASPSTNFSWYQLVRQLFADMLLFGNGVAVYADGQLFPVSWESVTIQEKNGKLFYTYVKPNLTSGESAVATQDNVLHLRDRQANNTIVGQSRLSTCKPVLEFALAVQEANIATWSNSTAPSAALQTDQDLGEDEKKRLQQAIQQSASRHKRGSVVILSHGLKWLGLGANQVDIEAQATREWIVIEVARVFGIPPPLLQDYTRANYSNAVEAAKFLNRFVLAQHSRNLEDEFTKTFLTQPHHLVLDRSEYSRDSLEERTKHFVSMIDKQVLTPEQVKAIEGYE